MRENVLNFVKEFAPSLAGILANAAFSTIVAKLISRYVKKKVDNISEERIVKEIKENREEIKQTKNEILEMRGKKK